MLQEIAGRIGKICHTGADHTEGVTGTVDCHRKIGNQPGLRVGVVGGVEREVKVVFDDCTQIHLDQVSGTGFVAMGEDRFVSFF